MKPLRLLASSLVLALLTGCAVGPDYHLPEFSLFKSPQAQGSFVAASTGSSQAPIEDHWWKLYGDAQLDALIEAALMANTDVRIAAARVARAEGVLEEAHGAQEPSLDMDVGVSRAQLSGEEYLLEEALPVLNLGDAGLAGHFNLDLAGGLKRAVEAAQADQEASQAALEQARLAVVAELVQAWGELCSAGREQQISQHRLELLEDGQQVVERLVNAGRRPLVDLSRAQAQVAQFKAGLPVYEARRRLALYRIAVLSGRPPRDYPQNLARCHGAPQLTQPIPVGDGAGLLKRRPDVRQAERHLAGATARIGVATAALYPSISIGYSLGATGLLEHMGQARTQRWSLGPLISWTLPGEAEKARVHQADAAAAAALANFDGVVLRALGDVEGALTVLARDLDRQESLQQAHQRSEEAAGQVRRLYQAGRLPYVDDLAAQNALAASEAELAAMSGQVVADQVRLFLALGGGWSAVEVPETRVKTVEAVEVAAH